MMPRPMNPIVCAIIPPGRRRVGGLLNGGRAAVKYHVLTRQSSVTPKIGRFSGFLSGFPSPKLLRQPVQAEIAEGLGQRLTGLLVVADPRVPDVDHLVPLGADGLALGGPIVGRRAVPSGRLL